MADEFDKLKFGFGLIGQAKPYFDTAKKEMEVKLDRNWKQVTLDVSGMDLRRINTKRICCGLTGQRT